MRNLILLPVAVMACFFAVVAGCGGGDDGGTSGTASPGADASYEQGDVRLEIEYLDTGLLKGHAYGDAADGWTVTGIKVEAVDPDGKGWPVIEPERTGVGSGKANEFFEVTIEELERGKQITLTATVTFRGQGIESVERTATDSWPP